MSSAGVSVRATERKTPVLTHPARHPATYFIFHSSVTQPSLALFTFLMYL